MFVRIIFFLLRPILPILLVLFLLRKLYMNILIWGFWICLIDGIYLFFTKGNYGALIIAFYIGLIPFLCFVFEKVLYKDEELMKKRNGVLLENDLHEDENEDEDDTEDSNYDVVHEKNSFLVLLSYITPFWLYVLFYGIYDYCKHKNFNALVLALILFVLEKVFCSSKNKNMKND